MEDKSQYKYRFISRMVIEAMTPIAVGTGDKDIISDARVIKDVNGLPYIPGTSLAGVIRHAVGESNSNSNLWGFQNKDDGKGSEIIFSNANLVDERGVPVDSFVETDNDFLKRYMDLPVRQHTKIDYRGVAAKHGKFDEEIVFKGSRFCFEIEILSKEDDEKPFNNVIEQLYKNTFRIGGGTRSGFGEMKVVSCKKVILDLMNDADRERYLEKSSSLSESSFWKDIADTGNEIRKDDEWTKYELNLKPDNFFLFGSGLSSDDADMTPVTESYICWDGARAKFLENNILIPATSVKGALAHRVAYYYNQKSGYTADGNNPEDYKNHIGTKNTAVVTLFGTEETKNPDIQRGNIMISDLIQQTSDKGEHKKLLNHVSIDRFTGGAIDGALFSECVTDGHAEKFTLTILVKKSAFNTKDVKYSLEKSLDDICNGMLSLGGGVNRGNGIFNGTKKVEE